MKQALILLLLCFFTTLPALAAGGLPAADFSSMELTKTIFVDQVIDPYTIRLEDKEIVRLPGIEYPDYNPNMPGPLSLMAVKILKDMLEGKKVNIYQPKGKDFGRSNRMGQQLAHIELAQGGAWAQGSMLALGLARVMTDERNATLSDQMYKVEQQARKSKSGIWALEKYKVFTPDEAQDHIGAVGVVEGRVHGTKMNQNRIYINFGQDWREDFTISIMPEHRRNFFDRNIDPLKWNGKTLRVRGWIGNYNGPYIEADHPEQIEILEQK